MAGLTKAQREAKEAEEAPKKVTKDEVKVSKPSSASTPKPTTPKKVIDKVSVVALNKETDKAWLNGELVLGKMKQGQKVTIDKAKADALNLKNHKDVDGNLVYLVEDVK